ncbi:hypothetical protein ALC57_14935 [Trachymyrmex cornetzi]|uniref:Uncharacterized protein n=1 Tax=Trachymyrmex cornetzi TaxID=471704 RepID=A0A195DJ15_9HYME|nr:hypothetical protein ALC57_14935 [Trachymyrmex cornetzi]
MQKSQFSGRLGAMRCDTARCCAIIITTGDIIPFGGSVWRGWNLRTQASGVASGHHSLRLERKEGKTCGGIACSPRALRVRKTLGGFGDDRRCVVGGGGGASRPLQRLCIAISLCV